MSAPTEYNEPAQLKWVSFLAPLTWALVRARGTIVEVGAGHFSTPFLHEYAAGLGVDLVTIEDNPEWYVPFAGRYNCDTHYITDRPLGEVVTEVAPIAVAFIDNCGGGVDRAEPFRLLLAVSDYVVMHDYHGENREAIEPLLDNVNHRVWSDYEPPTLVATRHNHLPI